MKVKTLTGPSIHAALAEARMLLGDDVVLLESVAPAGGMPARVTVMVDEAPTVAARGLSFSPEASGALRPPKTDEAPAPSVATGGYGAVVRAATAEAPNGRAPSAETAPRPRGRLFPGAAEPKQSPMAGDEGALGRLVETQFRLLNERLAQMESAFGEKMIGANMQWAANPLFSSCLRQGLQPGTTARLFDRIAVRGFSPDSPAESLQWGLAQELRGLLESASPKQGTGTILLVGPSGSGKTSLALRLARHPNFFGRRRTTAIVVQPEDDPAVAYVSPVELYRRFEIPVQSVSTPAEMEAALGRVSGFDQILIDTPPMPMEAAEARKMIREIKRMTDPIVPLQVHLVLDVTRRLDSFSGPFFRDLPLRPDAVDLTHLDEAGCWGPIAEWIAALGMPVQYLSTARRIPDGLVAFSPSWFVEELMQL